MAQYRVNVYTGNLGPPAGVGTDANVHLTSLPFSPSSSLDRKARWSPSGPP